MTVSGVSPPDFRTICLICTERSNKRSLITDTRAVRNTPQPQHQDPPRIPLVAEDIDAYRPERLRQVGHASGKPAALPGLRHPRPGHRATPGRLRTSHRARQVSAHLLLDLRRRPRQRLRHQERCPAAELRSLHRHSIGIRNAEAQIAVDNHPSRRVAEKAGSVPVGTYTEQDGTDMIIY